MNLTDRRTPSGTTFYVHIVQARAEKLCEIVML